MRTNPLPPVEFLLECFSYDPTIGILAWRERPLMHFATEQAHNRWNGLYAGLPIDSDLDGRGYLRVGIVGKRFLVHRVIYKLMTGLDPTDYIDHRDLNKSNNIWTNLRPATFSENRCNCPVYISSSSKTRGVSWHSRDKKWIAQIQLSGKKYHIGSYENQEDAAAAYAIAATRIHKEFARTGTNQ